MATTAIKDIRGCDNHDNDDSNDGCALNAAMTRRDFVIYDEDSSEAASDVKVPTMSGFFPTTASILYV